MVEAGRGVQTVISSMDAGYDCQLLIIPLCSEETVPNTAQLFYVQGA